MSGYTHNIVFVWLTTIKLRWGCSNLPKNSSRLTPYSGPIPKDRGIITVTQLEHILGATSIRKLCRKLQEVRLPNPHFTCLYDSEEVVTQPRKDSVSSSLNTYLIELLWGLNMQEKQRYEPCMRHMHMVGALINKMLAGVWALLQSRNKHLTSFVSRLFKLI